MFNCNTKLKCDNVGLKSIWANPMCFEAKWGEFVMKCLRNRSGYNKEEYLSYDKKYALVTMQLRARLCFKI